MSDGVLIDGDIVKALQWCRLGRVRPDDDGAFLRAKALGLLAQDDVWRTTAQGDGVLIAAGLLEGKPEPRLVQFRLLWADHGEHYDPSLVAAFSEGLVDSMPEEYERQRREAERSFCDSWCDHGNDDGPCRFFTTVETTPRPVAPDTEVEGDTAR